MFINTSNISMRVNVIPFCLVGFASCFTGIVRTNRFCGRLTNSRSTWKIQSSFENSDDPNKWSQFNDDDVEEEDWQETLKKRQETNTWGSSFEPSTDGPVAATPEIEEQEAWLDTLQSITADEIEFMNKEADRADKVRQMQEYGYTAEQIQSTLGVEVDRAKEVDTENPLFETFQEETTKTTGGGFSYYLDDEEVEKDKVESHTTVERDEETGELIRHQMVYVDEHSCIGCTNCAMIAQSTFFMHEEHGRARVFQQWGDDDETIKVAIETCPVDCIHYVPYNELVALEKERRDQNINFKARLVSQGEYGGGQSHRVGGAFKFTEAQKISGNSAARCRNCPTAGCLNCPMYGVGENPEFKKREKKRLERRAKKKMKEQMEKDNKSVDL